MSGAARGPQLPDSALVSQLSTELGVDIDAELAVLSMTHRSYAYENGGLPTNERLEFLGDSVLGIVVTEELYRTHPDLPEGQLAKLRASIVNMHALAGVARAMNLGQLIRLGNGEELTGGRDKASILADAVEAILGALYLQLGLEPTRGVIHRLFHELIVIAPSLGAGLDWKTSLQELSAAEGLGLPVYEVTEDGPDHAKTFEAVVIVGGEPLGNGAGRTKKEAEQQAAATAYNSINDGSDATPADDTAAGDTAAGPADQTAD
ncbi:ribonuclease III [Nakamurella lactea]|uniref:ribonuclease III n=1 Tax=Nakamurella lactea TaxID=459515 RepID=UPI0004205A40|nr:ribonuclease III [Nakamurella lactea]